MERVGALVASVLVELQGAVAPGTATGALDELCRTRVPPRRRNLRPG